MKTLTVDFAGKCGSLVQSEGNFDVITPPRVLVLGVGNVLLSDEGFGVRVAEALDGSYAFPDDVQVMDGGTLGMELLRFISGTEKLLILDAMKEDSRSDGCRRLAGEAAKSHFREKLSAHEVGIQDVLTFLEITGNPVGEVVVIGAEPKSLEVGLALSEKMVPRVREATEMAVAELERWGVELKRKDMRGTMPCV